ncbi:DUF982 domain-containing protein [Rhizobium leguminosarum]
MADTAGNDVAGPRAILFSGIGGWRKANGAVHSHNPALGDVAYIAALEACEGVDDGHVSDESARQSFLLALKEAEIPYSTDIERGEPAQDGAG